MGTDSAALNDILQQVARFDAAIEAFATSIGCDSDRARLAVFELPLQVVRFYLPERVVPNAADHYVVQVYNGLLLAE
ncbi:hypothetical protein [Actibacterium mucosum]|nr:hypothetical protein [Actibacterium mucosum]